MKLKTLTIRNFKSFQDVTIHLDPNFNVFTGVNNSGKTNLLEAISLWHECFNLLIRQAKKAASTTGEVHYQRGQYILGTTQDKYFTYEQIKTVRSVEMEDIFYLSDPRHGIELRVELETSSDLSSQSSPESLSLEIGFSIKKRSGANYIIELMNYSQFDFSRFNQFFRAFPQPISSTFVSPVAAIPDRERYLTQPQILEALQKRHSIEVIRNRLINLNLMRTPGRSNTLYNNFLQTLSEILFQGGQQLEFLFESDPDRDVSAIVNYRFGPQDPKKDLVLLGSGTLQIIAILLNLYAAEQQPDLNLILFDEPDSHIHREVQKRLLDTLQDFSPTSQVFLTTHNESFIRQVPLANLFHIEARSQFELYALAQQTVPVGPRFKGIYPSSLNPVIASLGESNGLDFINAIEADRIIFVEGPEDAQALYKLLQKAVIPRNTRKYVFWVLGGVNTIFKGISQYKTVFQEIKNQKTLWEKSVLVFDRDYLTDADRDAIMEGFRQELHLETYLATAYTWESILLTDLEKCAHLLQQWLLTQPPPPTVNITDLQTQLSQAYQSLGERIEARLEAISGRYTEREQIHHRYCHAKRDLEQQKPALGRLIQGNSDVNIANRFNTYSQTCLRQGEFFKLANKADVEFVIAAALHPYSVTFSIQEHFLELIDCVGPTSWFPDWDFLHHL